MLTRHRDKWAVRIDGKRLSTGYDATPENRGAAEQKAREIIRTYTQQTYGDTVMEIVRAYKDDMAERAKVVVGSWRVTAAEKQLKPFFERHYPGDVTPEECRAYIAKRRKAGRSDGTIRRELGVLRAALLWKDRASPARFDMPPPGEPRTRFLTRKEFVRLLKAAEGSHHVAVFLHLAIATGARKEAILGLRWDTHIDFEKRQVWLGFKQSGKGRTTVPMTKRLFTVLKNADEMKIGDFVVEWAGKQIADIDTALGRVYERAGLGDIPAKAHTLRRTSGAWAVQRGASIYEVSKRLGHSSVAVTERHYAHLAPDHMKRSTEALEV